MRNLLFTLSAIIAALLMCSCAARPPHLSARQLSDSVAVLLSQGRCDSSLINLLDKSIAIDANIPTNYSMKATILSRMGQFQEALNMFQAIEEEKVYSDEPTLIIQHGIQFALTKDTIQARRKWERALSIHHKEYLKTPNVYHLSGMLALTRILKGKTATQQCLQSHKANLSKEDQVLIERTADALLRNTDKEVMSSFLNMVLWGQR